MGLDRLGELQYRAGGHKRRLCVRQLGVGQDIGRTAPPRHRMRCARCIWGWRLGWAGYARNDHQTMRQRDHLVAKRIIPSRIGTLTISQVD